MAKSLEMVGKISLSSFDGKVTFYFDKLDPKGPNDVNQVGVVEYNSNLGLWIWQKFGQKPIKITVEEAVD